MMGDRPGQRTDQEEQGRDACSPWDLGSTPSTHRANPRESDTLGPLQDPHSHSQPHTQIHIIKNKQIFSKEKPE